MSGWRMWCGGGLAALLVTACGSGGSPPPVASHTANFPEASASATPRPPPLPTPSPPPPPRPRATPTPFVCQGVALRAGQADIDANPPGTTFCLTGVHTNWSLEPKDGDSFIGPAVLDGQGSTAMAFSGTAHNVTLQTLTVQHYAAGDQVGPISPNERASGWTLRGLDVGSNLNAGVNPSDGMRILGGRIHDNGQEGMGAGGVAGVLVDGVEIDHNNTRHIDCGYEAGGFKWVATDVTVRNSRIHDNYCKGLWSDINASSILIQNNQIYNNDDEGIFMEISTHITITGNTVYGNGFKTNGNGCTWLWGGGITIASSGNVEISGNNVHDNCNGITGTQQDRPDGHPGLLMNLSVHGNSIDGPGKSGAAQDNGADLATRNIVFANNTLNRGQTYCGVSC